MNIFKKPSFLLFKVYHHKLVLCATSLKLEIVMWYLTEEKCPIHNCTLKSLAMIKYIDYLYITVNNVENWLFSIVVSLEQRWNLRNSNPEKAGLSAKHTRMIRIKFQWLGHCHLCTGVTLDCAHITKQAFFSKIICILWCSSVLARNVKLGKLF